MTIRVEDGLRILTNLCDIAKLADREVSTMDDLLDKLWDRGTDTDLDNWQVIMDQVADGEAAINLTLAEVKRRLGELAWTQVTA